MEYVTDFRELKVYRLARKLTLEIYELTKSFPKEETYSLSSQLRRASRSVGAQIAESWSKRRYINHFISKLTDADGEQHESQHWIETALDCQLISSNQAVYFIKEYKRLGRMIGKMIEKADTFCKPNL